MSLLRRGCRRGRGGPEGSAGRGQVRLREVGSWPQRPGERREDGREQEVTVSERLEGVLAAVVQHEFGCCCRLETVQTLR